MATVQKMLAYHGDQGLKDYILAELVAHREADRLIKGQYWQQGKGCAVGCTLESLAQREGLTTVRHSDHVLYERFLGVPAPLARLEDALFEALPNGLSQAWPERFSAAIRPGADLGIVWQKFLLNLLSDPAGGVQRQCRLRPAIAPAVQGVVDLYVRWIDGVKPGREEWQERRADAADAADAAAAAAAAAADAYAAAAAAAAAYAAAERIRQADALIALLEQA